MPKVIINGTLSPVSKPTEVDFDPTRGLIMHVAYESAGANLGGLANTFLNHGIAFRWVNSGVKSTLDATVSGGTAGFPDIPQTSWQLLANEGQFSVLEGQYALQQETKFPGIANDIKAGAAALDSGDKVTYLSILQDLPEDQQSAYTTLVSLLSRGTTHFARGQYALKRSVSVSNFYTGGVATESQAELILGFGEVFNFGLPGAIESMIASINQPNAQEDHVYGWRQLPSTAVTGAQNRVEISTEWWLDLWSTVLYGLA